MPSGPRWRGHGLCGQRMRRRPILKRRRQESRIREKRSRGKGSEKEEETVRSCFFTDFAASSKKASVLLRFLVRQPAICASLGGGAPGDAAFLAVLTADTRLSALSR